jgi:hypothetical protein
MTLIEIFLLGFIVGFVMRPTILRQAERMLKAINRRMK